MIKADLKKKYIYWRWWYFVFWEGIISKKSESTVGDTLTGTNNIGVLYSSCLLICRIYVYFFTK